MRVLLEIPRGPPLAEPGSHAALAKGFLGHTQLRRSENYTEKWQYVLRNPVRAKLVENIEDWPYQGEMNVLMW
jgi:hypothetical protein